MAKIVDMKKWLTDNQKVKYIEHRDEKDRVRSTKRAVKIAAILKHTEKLGW